MKNKITHRLTSYFALILLLFALLTSVIFSLMFAQHTAGVTTSHLKDHAATIAQTIGEFTASYEDGACKGGGFKAYMRFVGDFAMGDLFLLDAQSLPVMLEEMPPPAADLPEGAQQLVASIFETGKTDSYSLSSGLRQTYDLIAGAPVLDNQGNVKYALLLRSPVGSVEHTLRDAFHILSAGLAIAMVLAVIASVFLSRRFVTPLHRMKIATTKLTDGDYSAKTNVQQSDEIGVLAEHIDTLAKKLDGVKKEREQLDQMRQDFFSDISHELRTPIAVLKGSIELLRSRVIDDSVRRQEYYDQLFKDVNHLERLVNDLLELTRLQNPHFKISMSAVNLTDILHDTVRSMTPHAQSKQIAIELDNQAGPFPVLGDYTRLRQLMVILLDNAIKFSPEQSSVQITARRLNDRCEVTVADHGCGIDEAMLPHIFDRFFHSKSQLNRSGSGLGLPIAKEIALRHQIDISCKSAPGKGACFTLVFSECEIPEE